MDRKLFKKIPLKYASDSSSSVLLMLSEKSKYVSSGKLFVVDAVLFCLHYPKIHIFLL